MNENIFENLRKAQSLLMETVFLLRCEIKDANEEKAEEISDNIAILRGNYYSIIRTIEDLKTGD